MPLHLHPDVATTDTDDGTVLLHMGTGRYFQLNPTGTTVLHHLLDGHTPQDIAAELATRHRIPTDTALADVTTVLNHLHDAGLVIPA